MAEQSTDIINTIKGEKPDGTPVFVAVNEQAAPLLPHADYEQPVQAYTRVGKWLKKIEAVVKKGSIVDVSAKP